jgi:hypothetical protein
MTSGQIVAIVVLVLLVAAVVAAVMIFRRRSPSQRRLEAAQARREAEARSASAERLEIEARQRAERAKAEQAQAEELAAMARHDREVAKEQQARAEKLDPDHTEADAAVQSGQQRPAVAARPDPVREPRSADRPVDARDGAHDRTRDAHADADHSRGEVPRRSDERPRHQDYRQPEPIVAGAAAGMVTPRTRPTDESAPAAPPTAPTAPSAPTVPTAPSASTTAPTTGPAAGPARGSVPVDGQAKDRSTVGEFVRDKSRPAEGASDPTHREHDGVADPAAEQHHQSPVRSFADRLLGRS